MGEVGAVPLLYGARPRLRLDGAAAPGLDAGLLGLTVEETAEGLAHCEATFGAWGSGAGSVGLLYQDRRTLEFGRPFAVAIGAGQGADLVFEGRITALEGRFPSDRPAEMLVLAEDRLQDLRMTRRTRVFEDASVEDVARAIASDHGLTADVDLDGPTWPALAQLNQSDLAFLRERAADVDAEVRVSGDTLTLKARSRGAEGEATVLTWGRGLRELSVAADLAGQCSSLTVGGWDVAAKAAVESEAGPSTLAGEAEGDTGADVLEAAFAPRAERIVHRLPLSEAEGEALAGAEFRRRARRFLRGEATAEGDARLVVGAEVELRGVGPLFEGAYRVVAVRHVFDPEVGLRTEFTVERPWIGAAGVA